MKKIIEPIKIKIAHCEPKYSNSNLSPREAFWYSLRKTKGYEEKSIQSFEGSLNRDFGERLRKNLIQNIKSGLRDTEEALYGREIEIITHDFEFYLRRLHDFEKSEYLYSHSFEPVSRLIEFRQQMIKDIPVLKQAVEKIALISGITLVARIESYGSLNLNLVPSSLEKLSQVFDNEFESFQVFLEAFIPKSFGDVFTDDFANSMTFDIDIPSSTKQAFAITNTNNEPPSPTLQETQQIQPTMQTKSESVQKAEWLWKLANGSLLIPLILALAVLYFGIKELSSYKNAQYEAVKPILEHQLKLLQEDRKRMFNEEKLEKKEKSKETKVPNKANSADAKSRAAD